MEYSYPEIRDVFTICAEAVAPDLGTNRGYIRPRSDGMGKILQNILSMNGVEFELKPGGLSIVSGANVQEIFFDLGQNEAIDATVNEISEDLDLPMRVNRLFRRAANYNPNARAEHANQEEQKQKALGQLKNIIEKIEFDIRSSDGGKYNYFYFPTDKLTTAEAAFNTLGIFTQRHTTHLDGRVATVLRRPATMLSGNELTVIHELNKAIRARRMERNRDAFDRGTADVYSKAGIDELKKLIKFIDNVYYTNDPNHHYYYLYFNDIDRAFDIMSELGVRGIEKYYSSSQKTYVLRLDENKVSSVAQNIITELQREIATRGINYSNNMGRQFKI
jgi:hypothetical protein